MRGMPRLGMIGTGRTYNYRHWRVTFAGLLSHLCKSLGRFRCVCAPYDLDFMRSVIGCCYPLLRIFAELLAPRRTPRGGSAWLGVPRQVLYAFRPT
jgi:hypothetical protein